RDGRAPCSRASPPRTNTPAWSNPPGRRRGGREPRPVRRAGGCRRRAGAGASIQQADQAMELLAGERVARLDGDGALQLADGLANLVLAHVDASEVEEGKVAGGGARRPPRAPPPPPPPPRRPP